MKTGVAVFMSVFLFAFSSIGQQFNPVLVDSKTKLPLPNASVFDCRGKTIGISALNGRLPYISEYNYPISIRYLGYKEIKLNTLTRDTIYMDEVTTQLPEVVVQSGKQKLLHILAYVREYSTLSTYTDSVFMFREKMVDYMVAADKGIKFKCWNTPRLLNSNSYYRFTNSSGLDSVSDKCAHHFSWSDWIGIIPSVAMPRQVSDKSISTDTVMGKYSPVEIWRRNDDRVTVDIDVLAAKSGQRWVTNLALFFNDYIDFEYFKMQYRYSDVIGDTLSSYNDLSGYSFSIESKGRGRDMFQFHKTDESFSVSTYGEVYILDKEYITVKEAKSWANNKFKQHDISIIESSDAPELQPEIIELIARVNNIDHTDVRLKIVPDHRLIGRKVKRQNIGQRALQMLKDITGISSTITRHKFNSHWKEFRDSRKKQMKQQLPK